MRIQVLIAAAGLFGVAVMATGQTTPRAPAAGAAAGSAAELAQGRRLYIRCAACHALAPTTQAKIGPHLQRIVGRRSGTIAGFNYSPAMRQANITWDAATLDRWLQRPQSVVPGTSMAFAGLSNPADRRALIAYLRRPN